MATLNSKAFLGAAMGTLLEYYDYALFLIFQPILSPLFFPGATVYESLVKGYTYMLVTIVVRPLGGLAFGYIGDRFGRRSALLTSMYGIALATTSIGLMPSYATIGVWATLILISAKAVQSACFGGEFNGAGIYVVEHASRQAEGLASSLLSAATLTGSLLASLVGVVLTFAFMPAWSWRLAFILGGCVGLLAIFFRSNLTESPDFKKSSLAQAGFCKMLKIYPRELIAGICIGGMSTVAATTTLTFINPVLMSKGFFNHHSMMWIQAFIIICAVITLPFAGWAADRKSPAKIMNLSSWLIILSAYPLLWLVDHGGLWTIVVALSVLMVFNEVFLGPCHTYLKNLYPSQYRYRAISLSFCIGMSTFGGLTPVIESYLYSATGHFTSLAPWLMISAAATLLSMYGLKPALQSQRSLATQH